MFRRRNQPRAQCDACDGLARDTRGLTTVEYVIVLVLIAVGGIGLWKAFGGSVNAKIDDSTVRIRDMDGTTGRNGDPGQNAGNGDPGQNVGSVGNNANEDSNTPSASRSSGRRGDFKGKIED